jgi:adenylosuccinate lyase
MSIESNTPDPSLAARDAESATTRPPLSTPVVKQQSLREIFSARARRQRYLDVEAALALAQADLGVIPRDAGDKIAAAARLELLDADRMAAEQAATGHSMVPLISE